MTEKPPHPGTITYLKNGEFVKQELASGIDERFAFVETPEGWVPVVRVEASFSGGRAEIAEYGPNGERLRATYGTTGSDA